MANQKMNATSSRSHAVLIVTVRLSRDLGTGMPSKRTSKLLLVDLAGSERVARSGVEGQQFEEAKAVNLSLTALGKCIQALTDPTPGHIPFRDNKLTRLLKDSFGGSARTSLIVCIGPMRESANETTSSLAFGTRALRVENSLKVREEVDFQVLCRRLQAQVDLMHRDVELSEERVQQAEARMVEAETRAADLEVQQLAAEAQASSAKELEQMIQQLRDQVAEQQRRAEAAEGAAAGARKELQGLRDLDARRVKEKEKAVQEAARLRGQVDEMSASLAEAKDALAQSEDKYHRAMMAHGGGPGGAAASVEAASGASMEQVAELEERSARQEGEINYLVGQLREMEVTSALQRGAAVDRLLEHFVNIGTAIRRSGTARPLTETSTAARLLIAAQMAKYEFGLVGHDARAPPPDVPGIKDALLAALSDPSMVPSSRVSVAPPDGAASGVSESFFGEPAGVSMTIGLLSYPDRDVRLHAVKVLANLAADETRQVMILQEGGLPALLSILTNGDEEAACRVAAVRPRARALSPPRLSPARRHASQGLVRLTRGEREGSASRRREQEPKATPYVGPASAGGHGEPGDGRGEPGGARGRGRRAGARAPRPHGPRPADAPHGGGRPRQPLRQPGGGGGALRVRRRGAPGGDEHEPQRRRARAGGQGARELREVPGRADVPSGHRCAHPGRRTRGPGPAA